MNLVLVSALVLAVQPDRPFAATAWEPLFAGVELADLSADRPRPMKGHAVRIDLTAPGVGFLATPDNGDRPSETDGLKTSTFLARHKLQVAVNAAPFGPVRADNAEGNGLDVAGLQISGGKAVSGPNGNYPALLVAKGNTVRVARPPFDTAGVENAVGGFHVVLERGGVIEGDESIHPRTAAGVSADGKSLVLLVIDGRQRGYSGGATTGEVGAWLKALGAADGINLDGGGTTTLVVAGDDGKPRVVNRPIHAGKPGTERVSASHLGVYAKPLK